MAEYSRAMALRLSDASFRVLITTILFFGMLGVVACDRNIEPYEPGEQAREPDLARIFPAPAGEMGSAESAGESIADSGGTTRGAVPPSRAEAGARTVADVPTDGAAAIEGRVELDPALAMARPDRGVLFVIARPQGSRGGPPLAVLRIPDPELPLDFRIGPEHVMIPSMRFEGAISLSARLDADGNAMTRGATDLSSAVAEGLAPGARDVRLVLGERG